MMRDVDPCRGWLRAQWGFAWQRQANKWPPCRGGVSIHILALMVPVFFGLMGFAIDLGRLYLAHGELKSAAEAMALAAAARLIGTEASTSDAIEAARRQVESASGFGNRYDFGSLVIGEANGSLNSEIVDPTFYATPGEATGEGDTAGGQGTVGGTAAKHVRVELVGETPIIFWRFLSLGQEGKVPLRVRAAAGISAPLCTACGIEPLAIAPLDASDSVNFGFTFNTRYTFGYFCTGTPIPQPLPNTAGRVQYLLLNRFNDEATVFAEDSQQLFRAGAQGLPPSSNQARACFTINAEETLWASATALACNANRVQTAVNNFLCGLATRLDTSNVQGCDSSVAEYESLSALYQPDTDLNDLEDYTGYTGNTRRILTIPIVDILNPTGTMVVLGFRQFLLQPAPNSTGISPNDGNGRFIATYLGNVAPLRQGRFGSCGVTSGPGKVVLHR
ncbi:MAG: pilus assembly protein TadG-related protein [Bryobacteraceae bacterium]|nr:pilus assembly protein TadG-related protein [Bryobacteraceae bacterium]MDW8379486.1 pilus assembly protein TadG-related protein [Bryobacterales bacterium]